MRRMISLVSFLMIASVVYISAAQYIPAETSSAGSYCGFTLTAGQESDSIDRDPYDILPGLHFELPLASTSAKSEITPEIELQKFLTLEKQGLPEQYIKSFNKLKTPLKPDQITLTTIDKPS